MPINDIIDVWHEPARTIRSVSNEIAFETLAAHIFSAAPPKSERMIF